MRNNPNTDPLWAAYVRLGSNYLYVHYLAIGSDIYRTQHNVYRWYTEAANTGNVVQDRKQFDASRTPAGGTDSVAACTEPCSRRNRKALTDRRSGSQSRNSPIQAENHIATHDGQEGQCHAYKHALRPRIIHGRGCRHHVYVHWFTHMFVTKLHSKQHSGNVHVETETSGAGSRSTDVRSVMELLVSSWRSFRRHTCQEQKHWPKLKALRRTEIGHISWHCVMRPDSEGEFPCRADLNP